MKLLSYFDTKPKPTPLTAAEFARNSTSRGLQAAVDRKAQLEDIKRRVDSELEELNQVLAILNPAMDQLINRELELELELDQ